MWYSESHVKYIGPYIFICRRNTPHTISHWYMGEVTYEMLVVRTGESCRLTNTENTQAENKLCELAYHNIPHSMIFCSTWRGISHGHNATESPWHRASIDGAVEDRHFESDSLECTLFRALRVGSHSPITSGPALLCCPGEVHGSLSWVWQPGRDRDISPSLMTSGPSLPNAMGGKALKWIYFFFTQDTICKM